MDAAVLRSDGGTVGSARVTSVEKTLSML